MNGGWDVLGVNRPNQGVLIICLPLKHCLYPAFCTPAQIALNRRAFE